jgi:hypothetical protein
MAQFQQGSHLDPRQCKCQIKHWLRRNWITVQGHYLPCKVCCLILACSKGNFRNIHTRPLNFCHALANIENSSASLQIFHNNKILCSLFLNQPVLTLDRESRVKEHKSVKKFRPSVVTIINKNLITTQIGMGVRQKSTF